MVHMVGRNPWRAAAVVVLALAISAVLPACRDSDLPDQLFASEHFDYRTRPDDPFCPAVLESAEAHLHSTLAYLMLAWPPGRKVDYYRYRDQQDVSASNPCGGGHAACAEANSGRATLHTWRALDRHELVHAYLAHVGFPHAVYAEGIAELFRCDSVPDTLPAPSPDWQAELLRAVPGHSLASYRPASIFVRFLLDRFGPERFVTAYRRSRFGADAAGFAREFQELFDMDLAQAWAEARQVNYPDGVRTLCGCNGREVPVDGSETAIPSCEQRDDPQREGVFQVSSPSLMFIEAAADLPGGANGPKSCAGAVVKPQTFPVEPRTDRHRVLVVEPMEPGRFFMTGFRSLRIKTESEAAFASCETAPRFEAAPGRYYSALRLPRPARGPRYFPVRFATAQRFFTAGAGLYACRGCDDAVMPVERCLPASQAFGRDRDVAGDWLLVVMPGEGDVSLELNADPCFDPCRGAGGTAGCPPHC
jgi:hypothetical protein